MQLKFAGIPQEILAGSQIDKTDEAMRKGCKWSPRPLRVPLDIPTVTEVSLTPKLRVDVKTHDKVRYTRLIVPKVHVVLPPDNIGWPVPRSADELKRLGRSA